MSESFSRAGGVAIYEWRAWDSYLIQAVFPQAHPIAAQIGESSSDLLARLPPGSRFVIFHIGLTQSGSLPVGRSELPQRLADKGILVLNADCHDYSKRRVQQACRNCGLPVATANEEGDPDQLVIIKTDWNYGGAHEQMLSLEEARILGLQVVTSPTIRSVLDYRVCARRQVPALMWSSPDLVIERYIGQGCPVVFRIYVLGERLVIETVVLYSIIKKIHAGAPRRILYFRAGVLMNIVNDAGDCQVPDVPSRLLSDIDRFRGDIGMEFGAIDVLLDESGVPYIIDANATPFWSRRHDEDILRFLRLGLEEFQPRQP
jgi:hypothetical protein